MLFRSWLRPRSELDGRIAQDSIASAEMALEGLQMMEAIAESARSGQWVELGRHAYAV